MCKIQFIVSLVIVLGLIIIPGLGCAAGPAEAPTPPPSPVATPAPQPPALSLPANESTAADLDVRLEWKASADANSYGLQVTTDPDFTNLIIDESEITSTYYQVASGLDWKTNYYWRVSASSAGGTSAWSAHRQFSTPIFQLGKIAFTSLRDGNAEVYVMNDDGSSQTRLTNSTADEDVPRWSPDGTKIAFSSMRDGTR